MDDESSPTWSRAPSEVACWFYALPLQRPSAEDVPAWLSDSVFHILLSLSQLAGLGAVEVTTVSQGEDTYTSNLDSAVSIERLRHYLRSCQDFLALSVSLSPVCVDLQGQSFPLSRGMELRFDVEQDDALLPLVDDAHPFNVVLSAQSNIYVEATFDGTGDNRAWARANRPLLSKIFQCLESATALRYTRCESRFSDQVRPGGFVNLGTDYRGYHVHDGTDVVHVVERLSDGADVVTIAKVRLVDRVLQIDYELAHEQKDAAARILVLEHLAPELIARVDGQAVKALHFRNAKSLAESELSWPPRPSRPPNPLR